MSTVAIDSARTSERLSAFLAEIGATEPIDNFFPKISALKELMKSKKTIDGGRQILYPIDSGSNTTIKDFSDFDVFDTSEQDTALTIVYPFVNKGGSISISWEEMRETAGSDHKIFDLVQHKRKNAMKSAMDKLATDLFAATQVANKINTLVNLVASTGTVGSLSQATDADWAATQTASGSFDVQGLSDMRTLYNTLVNNGDVPDTIITTQSVYEFYEKKVDPDVRYATVGDTVNRGWKTLEFKGIPIIHDLKATSGVLYMITSDKTFFVVDSEGDWDTTPFERPPNQKAFVSLLTFRGNLVCTRRKSNGKLTGITA